MRILKTLGLFMLCLSLMAGTTANAAMACCWNGKAPEASAKQNDGAAMPCHDTGDAASQNSAKNTAKNSNYKSCDCKSCIKMPVLSAQQPTAITEPSAPVMYTPPRLAAHQPGITSPPPKRIS